jgi:hypothetical protein
VCGFVYDMLYAFMFALKGSKQRKGNETEMKDQMQEREEEGKEKAIRDSLIYYSGMYAQVMRSSTL